MSDYERVAAAIGYLTARAERRPSLGEVARHVGLSPHHFQRTFRKLAGVSPKQLLQHLSAERAKASLRASRGVLCAALDAGLSGPGRLHDLMVAVEAVTPGEYGARGEGLVLRWGVAETPFGPAVLGITTRGVAHLSFGDAGSGLAAAWPAAALRRDDRGAARIARRVFAEPARVPLFLRGTNFQIQVWRALLRLPEGAVTTYGALARSLGRPSAARAVAGAVARNDIAVLVPCHRVLRETGALGGYRWGLSRKRALLAWEAARRVDSVPWTKAGGRGSTAS